MRGLRCPVLVGRGEELGGLTDLLLERRGESRTAIVTGEPGIGKSRLLATVADIARSRDVTVLRGRGAPSTAPAPYRPLAEAFLSLLRGRTIDEGALGAYRTALPVLLPGQVATDASDNTVPPSTMVVGEAALALGSAEAGAGGTLLVLDDLQWADAETFEVIDYLSDKLQGTPVAVVAAMRTGERAEAEQLAQALAARRHAELFPLRRLELEHLDAMVSATLGTSHVPLPVAEALARVSGGVPFLVEELLTTLAASGALWREGDVWRAADRLPTAIPPSFASLVATRLGSLSSAGRRAVVAAAVLGEQVRATRVAAALGWEERDALVALDEALAAQLLDRDPSQGGLRFHHGLSRAAVREQAGASERRAVAERALEALGAESDGRAGAPTAEDLIDLALEAGDTARAVGFLTAAAAAAMAQGACATARDAAHLAVQLATTAEQLAAAEEVLLDAVTAAGDAGRAAEVGRSLLVHLDSLAPDPRRRSRVLLRLGHAAAAATEWDTAERHHGAVAELADELPDELITRLDLLQATVALGRHRPADAVTAARRARERAASGDDAAAVAEAAALLGRAHRVLDPEQARLDLAEALAAAHRHGNALLVAAAAHEVATLDVSDAGPTHAMERARSYAEGAGALALVALCDVHLAILHWLHFDVERSRTCAQRAVDAAVRYQLGLLVPLAGLMVVGSDALLGRSDTVVPAFDRYLPLMDDEIEATQRGHVLALLALALEDHAEAARQLHLAVTLAPPGSDVARSPHSGVRALLLAVEGCDGAPALVAELSADPATTGVTRALVELAGAVLGGPADGDTATAEADRALRNLVAAPWFHAMALRLASEAALRDRWGRPEAWLRQAHDTFAGAGIVAPAAACRQLLRGAGVAAPRPPATGQHPELARLGITARESDVLGLVAEGLSNRQIAQRLVLSVRTIEKHVENLMAKTSAQNRTQLAALSNRLGDPGGHDTYPPT